MSLPLSQRLGLGFDLTFPQDQQNAQAIAEVAILTLASYRDGEISGEVFEEILEDVAWVDALTLLKDDNPFKAEAELKKFVEEVNE